MKKMILSILMVVSICSLKAAPDRIGYGSTEMSPRTYYKGNISPESLPEPIMKYLEKNYPDYTIVVSKRKGNGNYYVKIRFKGNNYRQYHRSLVFDSSGKVIKG